MKQLVSYILRQFSIKALFISILFITALIVFGFLAHEILSRDEPEFDQSVFNFFKAHTSDNLVDVMKVLTFFGSTYFFLPAYVVLIIYLWIRRRRNDAINITVIGVTSTLLMFILKEIFKRQRPELPLLKTLTNFSFPSGHALCSFIFCSVLIYLVWKGNWTLAWKWTTSIALFFLALAIGVSRVILRYHYASDVIAGICLGFAWVVLSLWVERKLTPKRMERRIEAA